MASAGGVMNFEVMVVGSGSEAVLVGLVAPVPPPLVPSIAGAV